MLCIFSFFSHITPVTDSFYQFSTKKISKSLIQHKMSSKSSFLITVKLLTTIQKSLGSLTFCRPGLHLETCSSGGSYPPLVRGSTERGRQTACVLLSHYFSNCFPWIYSCSRRACSPAARMQSSTGWYNRHSLPYPARHPKHILLLSRSK